MFFLFELFSTTGLDGVLDEGVLLLGFFLGFAFTRCGVGREWWVGGEGRGLRI
jgi:hypothetical protein